MSITKDELLQALKGLTADQISGILSNQGRSPLRERQLHDLTLLPSKDDPRPTFYQETDGREFQPIRQLPYPKLLWHVTSGQEITVDSEREERSKGTAWTPIAPIARPSTPEETARRLFESLPPEDQKYILEHQHTMQLDAVKKAFGNITPAQAAAITAPPKGKNGDRP